MLREEKARADALLARQYDLIACLERSMPTARSGSADEKEREDEGLDTLGGWVGAGWVLGGYPPPPLHTYSLQPAASLHHGTSSFSVRQAGAVAPCAYVSTLRCAAGPACLRCAALDQYMGWGGMPARRRSSRVSNRHQEQWTTGP